VIAAAEDARRDLTVDWVHLRLDDQASAPVSLQDPLASEDPAVDGLVGLIRGRHPVLPA
jgi:proteasome accessory factor A